MNYKSLVKGCGSYLPERVVTNKELTEWVDTSDDWIVSRTGIKQRYIAAKGELTSDLAIQAARRALKNSKIEARELDLLVLATTTPDATFPATATKVQRELGMTNGAAFDVQAVCSGFVYGLAIADNFIKAGQAKTVLLIGAETFSRILDWKDRSTCVLFGDGAGAIVMQATNRTDIIEEPHKERGVISTHLHSDGTTNDLLYVDGGPSSTQTAGHVRMIGREVFRHAVNNLADIVDETLSYNALTADALDWIVPHQANRRILDSTARKIGIPEDKIVITVENHANTSAASIPLALDQAVRDGRIKKGDLVLMEAMGGGLTWGSALVRW